MAPLLVFPILVSLGYTQLPLPLKNNWLGAIFPLNPVSLTGNLPFAVCLNYAKSYGL